MSPRQGRTAPAALSDPGEAHQGVLTDLSACLRRQAPAIFNDDALVPFLCHHSACRRVDTTTCVNKAAK
ncbi:MAG: hypothetical protein BJ554DRAFT_7034 [Olpidium bornovanus]|uniref:Uncharacterized protein n=1 Tax=Olpidium bornovanus TaxID=278681 RepID=A0A8H8DJM5_9FUNG|nr:MAG: hypothetical protein BJ554DRAFT_7034 [Olpidium bornovanus]